MNEFNDKSYEDTNFFTSYYQETKKNNLITWLRSLDNDTFSMLKDGVKKITINESPTMDLIFRDVYNLVLCVVEDETGIDGKSTPVDQIIDLIAYFCVLVDCESLSRKGLVKLEDGNGQLTNSTIKIYLSEKGKNVSEELFN